MTTPVATTTPIVQLETAKPKAQVENKLHQCPGHSELFHRYLTEKRADKKTSQEVAEMKKDSSIKEASFKVINKKDQIGKESGYFRGLNAIYKVATVLVFTHKDGSEACPYHPANKA